MSFEHLSAVDWEQTPFRELELIGAGAMGSVARARDARTGRLVALKLLADPNPTKQERFRREAQLTARVEHPNVIGIHEVYSLGAAGDLLVSELVEGARHLDEAWAGQPLEQRIAWLRDAARGVAAAHAVGVTHRAEARVFSRPSRSAESSSCSVRIFISSSLARWRSFNSSMASACTSLILNRFISTGLGLSFSRMIAMTSSMFR